MVDTGGGKTAFTTQLQEQYRKAIMTMMLISSLQFQAVCTRQYTMLAKMGLMTLI